MGGFIDFLINNYLIFLLITLILIFALIGYLVESKKEQNGEIAKPKKDEDKEKMMKIVHEKSEEELKEEIKKNAKQVSINEAVGVKPKESDAQVIGEVQNQEEVVNNSDNIADIPSGPKPTEDNALDSLNEE